MDTPAVYIPTNPAGAMLRPEWDQRLVVDVALNTPEEAILDAYQLQAHTLRAIYKDPVFATTLAKLKVELAKDGATFKMKCKLQAEAMLEQSWKLAHAENVDHRVQRQIIADTVRWAGYDTAQAQAGGGSSGLSITINLGQRKDEGITIEGERA